jgi:diacylglycerol kinase (ATP)
VSRAPFTRPHFIVNTRSAGAGTPRLDALHSAVRSVFPGAAWRPTTRAGDAADLAGRAAGDGADLVVAVGGDGTINEVVNGLLSATVAPPLGILPLGSGCDFARALGVRRTVAGALDVLASGRTRRIDLGEIECDPLAAPPGPARTRRFFVNMAGCGASARVVERFNQRRIAGRFGYAVAAAMTALDYRWPIVEVAVDGGASCALRLNLLLVFNGQYCGGGMRVAAGARLDDGVLDVVTAAGVGRVRSLAQWPQLYLGGLQRVAGLRMAGARVLHASSAEDVLVDCDGELCGRLPATYQVVPGRLTVCAP